MPEIKIVDTTLRDAHQCLWATRMTTAMMLPVAETMDRTGFDTIDLMSSPQFDVCVRYLKENPWERIRLMRRKVTHTKIQAGLRSRSLLSFDVQPDDVILLWLECMVKAGIRRIRPIDGLFNFDGVGAILRKGKELGIEAVGAMVYTHSPVHTDAFYAAKTKEMVERIGNLDVMKIKDPGGLLTPDRIRTLVPAMLKVMGKVPLELHSHCVSGLAPLVYLEGVKAGVTLIDTSIAPLASGPAQPATQIVLHNLRHMGYTLNIDDKLIDEVSEHFRKVAKNEGKPLGAAMEYDAFHYEHQVPCGMQSNFEFQLAQAGLSSKLDEVLHECARIRVELGYPVMVTPFSQLVGIQAVLNVVQGARYKTVPDEVKKYALGYYGDLVSPVDPDVLDRIVANGSPKIALRAQLPDPVVPALRKKYPNMCDEERLLRHLYAGSQVDDMLAAGEMPTEYFFDTPLVKLLSELSKRRTPARICIEKGSTRLEIAPAN